MTSARKSAGSFQFSLRQLLVVFAIVSIAMGVSHWRARRMENALREAVAESTVHFDEEKPLLLALVSQERARRTGLVRRLGLENIASGELGWDASRCSNLQWSDSTTHGDDGELQLHIFATAPDFKANFQRQTLVVTDARQHLLTWKELGDDAYFDTARIEFADSKAVDSESGDSEAAPPSVVLAVQAWRESGGGRRGVQRFVVSADEVVATREIEWRDSEFNAPAWRRWLARRNIFVDLDDDALEPQPRIGQE